MTNQTHQALQSAAANNVRMFDVNKGKYSANERAYLQGLHDIATKGRVKYSRPGQATLSLSGTQQRFDLTGGKIPLLGSKEIFHRSFLIENQWFLSGDDDIKFLKDRNVSIWDSWVLPETAVFEPTEKQTGSDVENYIRCHYPEVFKLLVEYKRNFGIGMLSVKGMKEFLDFMVSNSDAETQLKYGFIPVSPKPADWDERMADTDIPIQEMASAIRITKSAVVKPMEIPMVRLVSGKIGAGAYGPAWRKWGDVRLRMDRPVGNEHKALLARGFKSLSEDALIDDSDPMAWGDFYYRVIDQFADAVKMLRTGADSRRIIVSAWNAAKIDEAALPPCHSFIQFVSYDNFDGGPRDLVCNLFMRSNDAPIGKPFNIAQYAALTHLIAKITNHKAVELVLTVGDDHIYADQIPFLKEQFLRKPINLGDATIEYPEHIKELEDYINLPVEEVEKLVKGYGPENHHGPIRYPVAV